MEAQIFRRRMNNKGQDKMIKIRAKNDLAINAVGKALGAIDKRKRLDLSDAIDVISFSLAQAHRPSFKILGHKPITDILVAAGVLGKVNDRAEFFTKREFVDQDATFETVDSEEDFRSHPKNKSGCWFRTRESALTLEWGEIDALGNGPCQFARIVDLAETCGAFNASAAPSVRFLTCEYEPNHETATQFMHNFQAACLFSGVGLAVISDGLVVSNAHQALQTLNQTTIRFWNNGHRRLAFLTRDKHGRELTSWGVY